MQRYNAELPTTWPAARLPPRSPYVARGGVTTPHRMARHTRSVTMVNATRRAVWPRPGAQHRDNTYPRCTLLCTCPLLDSQSNPRRRHYLHNPRSLCILWCVHVAHPGTRCTIATSSCVEEVETVYRTTVGDDIEIGCVI